MRSLVYVLFNTLSDLMLLFIPWVAIILFFGHMVYLNYGIDVNSEWEGEPINNPLESCVI